MINVSSKKILEYRLISMNISLFDEHNRLKKNLNCMENKFVASGGLPELLEFC